MRVSGQAVNGSSLDQMNSLVTRESTLEIDHSSVPIAIDHSLDQITFPSISRSIRRQEKNSAIRRVCKDCKKSLQ